MVNLQKDGPSLLPDSLQTLTLFVFSFRDKELLSNLNFVEDFDNLHTPRKIVFRKGLCNVSEAAGVTRL